ncbi:hypothetical protein G5V57_33195 [Nordella sp. HKS 07]|uniref:VIT1/CCC1 transporter family protein n=1 Tax=Nordella sp. HKS 07 TaxID=2712222 RepID=UPI0013E1F01F|nr:VIT1/CCC1 transporter family protein [Nordella sp. HKS 07]QIG52132.1 hypothetical protein G5V57_33195 [Nordella sp. HKS 07]
MALSFTGTMSVAVAGGEEVRTVLMAALGCNMAWGIVDAVMFVLTTAADRARRFNFIDSVRAAPVPEARRILLQNLPEEVQQITSETDAELLLTRIKSSPAGKHRNIVRLQDFRAAISVFGLVVASTLPPSIPFLFIDHLPAAMRMSNAIALVMLFLIGARLGKYMGRSPWPMALAMTAIGAVLVAVTIALGG